MVETVRFSRTLTVRFVRTLVYQQIARLQKVVPPHILFRCAFNWSPMYRRSTGRVRSVSKDLHLIVIEIPLTWRNRNYVGTMFGGSMLSATDPIFMVQLINILGKEFVVWDKSVEMRFRRPARSVLSATFEFTPNEIASIQRTAREKGEFDLVKTVELTDRDGVVVAGGSKTIYIATKAHRKAKQAK